VLLEGLFQLKTSDLIRNAHVERRVPNTFTNIVPYDCVTRGESQHDIKLGRRRILTSFPLRMEAALLSNKAVTTHVWSVGTETCSERIKENKEKIVGCDCRLYV
jgi:hypothetical protein